MKRRVLVQVDEGTHVAWKARAFAEGRSMSDLARQLIESAVLTERGGHDRAGVEPSDGPAGLGGGVPAPRAVAPRSVSPADVAATIPGVRVASAVCGVCPPGRSRPSCSLPTKHDGKHSWEA